MSTDKNRTRTTEIQNKTEPVNESSEEWFMQIFLNGFKIMIVNMVNI